MSREPLLIWGTGGHAGVVAEIVQLTNRFELVGFLDDAKEHQKQTFRGLPVLPAVDFLASSKAQGHSLAIAIGNCTSRRKVMERAQQAGCLFPVLSHPTSIISPSAQLGTGTVLCAGSIVGTGAVLGTGCLLNTGSSVDHDCRLAEFVHVCPGAHLAGDVKVGAESWIGIGTAVIEGRTIGARSIIGAGSVVTRDLPDDVVAYGNPARIQKTRVN